MRRARSDTPPSGGGSAARSHTHAAADGSSKPAPPSSPPITSSSRPKPARAREPPTLKAEILGLQALLSQKLADLSVARRENTELQARSVALHTLMRVLQEIQRHRLAMGALTATNDTQQFDFLRVSLLAAEGGGGGALPDGAAGGTGTGAGGSNQQEETGAPPATVGMLEKLPHLAPGKSLLRLEGCAGWRVTTVPFGCSVHAASAGWWVELIT